MTRMGEFRAAGGRNKVFGSDVMCFPPPQGCWADIGRASLGVAKILRLPPQAAHEPIPATTHLG